MRPDRLIAAVLTTVLAAAGFVAACSTAEQNAAPAQPRTTPRSTPIKMPTTTKPPTTTKAPTSRPTRPTRPIKPAQYTFPIAGCRADYGRTHHDYPAADIFARVGCRFVAPTDGRVETVATTDRWDPKTNRGDARGGRSVSMVGSDGVRYYGAHLTSIASGIRPGATVRAGQELGRTGRSGSARNTTPHLHFGLSWPTPAGQWWIRRGTVRPQPYLDAWRAGRNTSPATEVTRARTAYGPSSRCTAYC